MAVLMTKSVVVFSCDSDDSDGTVEGLGRAVAISYFNSILKINVRIQISKMGHNFDSHLPTYGWVAYLYARK